MKRTNVKKLILCALFAALTAVLSQISIPIGPVPINLALISTFLAAGLLGAGYGALSQLVFILMGAAGLPVFAGFKGGMGTVLGPTGGYIIAYALCALLTGFIIDRFGGTSIKVSVAAICAGLILIYTLGTSWYSYISHTPFIAALSACVIPFLFGDALKTVLVAVLIKRLKPVLKLNSGI